MSKRKPEQRYPIQFRIGRQFLSRITRASYNEGISRNTWIVEAVQRRIRKPGAKLSTTSAHELMTDRVAIMVRMDELTLELLNEAAGDNGDATRTIWIIDACLASLARAACRAA